MQTITNTSNGCFTIDEGITRYAIGIHFSLVNETCDPPVQLIIFSIHRPSINSTMGIQGTVHTIYTIWFTAPRANALVHNALSTTVDCDILHTRTNAVLTIRMKTFVFHHRYSEIQLLHDRLSTQHTTVILMTCSTFKPSRAPTRRHCAV